MRIRRLFRKWWWLSLPIAIALIWVSGFMLDRAVRERLVKIGNDLAGAGYTFSIEKVDSHFLAGSIDVMGMALSYDTSRMKEMMQGDLYEVLIFSAHKLKLRHVSYWDLLMDGDVHFKAVEVAHPEIHYYFRPRSEHEEPQEDQVVVNKEEVTRLPSLISVDTLLIGSAIGSTTDITGTRPAMNIGGLDINAYSLELRSYGPGELDYWIGGADVHAWQLSAELPPLYDLNIADLHVHHPSGTALIQGTRLDPRATAMEYGELVEHEQDLFQIQVDTLQFIGIHVGRFISEQVLHMHRMEIFSPKATVHRDKTLADGPFKYKDLPVSGLRNIGISLRIDTVNVHNAKVEYHEKDGRGPDYGMVSFSDINGMMTGLNNSKDADTTSHLIANATGRVYENTAVELSYKAAMASSNDAFFLDARLGSLPFSVFNRMTDDLLQVKASDGKIHSMHLRMQGNEWQASGTLDLAYEDLQIDLVPNANSGVERTVKNMLGNALVRKRNMPDRNNYRQGEFVVDRRKDRAVFNFIWQAVKAGSVDTMAPGLLRKPMRKKVSHAPTAKK